MPQPLVFVELHRCAVLAQGLDPLLHGSRRGNPVFSTHYDERGRLGGRTIRVPGVRHDDGRRPRDITSSVARHAVRADRGGHPRTGGAPPQGVAAGADAECLCVAMDVRERRGQVPGGDRFAMPCLVLQDEGVQPLAADRHGMRKALVDGADIGEPAAWADDRERRAGPSAEEEQPRVASGRLLLPLGFGIEAVEDRPATDCLVDHAIERTGDRLRLDVAVVRQEGADASQRHPLVVGPVVPRQDQMSEAGERRVTQQISDGVLHTKVAALTCAHVGLPALERRCCSRLSVRNADEQHGQQRRDRREGRHPRHRLRP